MNVNFSDGKWLNEPTRWHVDHTGLTLTTDEKTDFWRKTYYGFTRDSGHFLGFPTADSFTAKVRIRGEFRTLYDQAGMMVRIDENRWAKTGVEFTDGDRDAGGQLGRQRGQEWLHMLLLGTALANQLAAFRKDPARQNPGGLTRHLQVLHQGAHPVSQMLRATLQWCQVANQRLHCSTVHPALGGQFEHGCGPCNRVPQPDIAGFGLCLGIVAQAVDIA